MGFIEAPFVPLAQFIESDRVLFFTWKLPISAKEEHFFGLILNKIKICGDILVSECHRVLAAFFSS